MSHQFIDASETIGLNIASIGLFIWSIRWMEMMTPAGQLLGILAAASVVALNARKLYQSFDNKRKSRNDD